MQPDSHRARARKYDTYNPGRVHNGTSYVPPASQQAQLQSNTSIPPHDIRSGYVPPEASAFSPQASAPQAESYSYGGTSGYAPQAHPAQDDFFANSEQVVQPMYSPEVQPASYASMPATQMSSQQFAHQNVASQAQYQITQQNDSQSDSAPVDQQILRKSKKSPRDFSVPSKKQRRGAFATIMHATVQVDRVTRQSVKAVKHTFEPPQLAALRTKRQKLFMRSFYTVAALSMFASVYLGVHKVLYGEDMKQQAEIQKVLSAQTNTQNDASRGSEVPSEKQPTSQDMKTYLVAPPYPRYLRIPSMSLDVRVRRLGLDSNGAVGSPNNINDIGWYDASVKPGEKDGASLMFGHLTGPTAHGAFWDIQKLPVDAKIEIEKGNGEIVRYKVKKVESVPNDEFNIVNFLSAEQPGINELRLITTSGKFDNVSVRDSGRYVVYAVQVP